MLETKLNGPSFSLAVSKFINSNSEKSKDHLVIAKNEGEAQEIFHDLSFYCPELAQRLVFLPDSETLPFDLERSPASIMSDRWAALNALSHKEGMGVVAVASAVNCMRLIAERDFWHSSKLSVAIGMPLPIEIAEQNSTLLAAWGYQQRSTVKSNGDYAFRGVVFDVFPVGLVRSKHPDENFAVRVYLENGIVSKITKLDCLTQESSSLDILNFDIYPNREYPINKFVSEAFRRESFALHENPRQLDSYKMISAMQDHPELLSWVGVNREKCTSIPNFIDFKSIVVQPGYESAVLTQDALINARHTEIKEDTSRVCPPIAASWLLRDEIDSIIDSKPCALYETEPKPSGMVRAGSLDEALLLLRTLMEQKTPTLFVMNSEVRQRHITVMLSMIGVRAKVAKHFDSFCESPTPCAVMRGKLISGFYDETRKYRVITEKEVFGSSIETSIEIEVGEYQRKAILQGLDDIQDGDPVVHAMLGRGVFAGFESLNMGDGLIDMIRIKYADDSATFVRVNDLDLVSRFSCNSMENIKLSKLNDDTWRKGLVLAQNSAMAAARELILIRNARIRARGIRALEPGPSYVDFCETFEHDETADQRRSIAEIIEDLTSGKPMDRLIVGDVGLGKTEVAMRPAFIMADQGYQVALLAPTTILAQQHYRTTLKRFENTSIKIMLADKASLSKDDLDSLQKGEPCIVIGTHRLLQNDVRFGNLGLYIIDEEHRFGVRQKEVLRSLRGNKHVLTLTATPIPRTLGMAMSGIRSISIISTPPARRQSVRTIVREPGNSVLREAIGRELSRNGQVFFLHNSIETMDDAVSRLADLFPAARIKKVHGKVNQDEANEILIDFKNHKFDILVCTTIIEVGIDIPNANTLIVENAENFGLSQLHQLRGRTGRSTRQAYAYLLTDSKPGSASARRMKAMEQASKIGEGILLARQDLEIRGIGEILGEEQSGHIHNIGFGLYMRLLEQAIKVLDEKPDADTSELMIGNVEMPVGGFIPESFIPNNGTRLSWYQRLLSSENPEELAQNMKALKDMYGYIPSEVSEFEAYVINHLKLKKMGFQSIAQDGEDTRVVITAGQGQMKAENRLRLKFGLACRPMESGPRNFLVTNTSADAVIRSLCK